MQCMFSGPEAWNRSNWNKRAFASCIPPDCNPYLYEHINGPDDAYKVELVAWGITEPSRIRFSVVLLNCVTPALDWCSMMNLNVLCTDSVCAVTCGVLDRTTNVRQYGTTQTNKQNNRVRISPIVVAVYVSLIGSVYQSQCWHWWYDWSTRQQNHRAKERRRRGYSAVYHLVCVYALAINCRSIGNRLIQWLPRFHWCAYRL